MAKPNPIATILVPTVVSGIIAIITGIATVAFFGGTMNSDVKHLKQAVSYLVPTMAKTQQDVGYILGRFQFVEERIQTRDSMPTGRASLGNDSSQTP